VNRLVKQAKNGDADAFVQLMEQNRQNMYKVAICYVNNPEDAADIIQDTVLTAFEKIRDLKQPRYFKTWLTRILMNKCKDFLDKRSWEVAFGELPETAYSDTALDNLLYEELIQAVEEQYRDILVLHYVKGFKSKEIAEVLGMKDATVRTRLRRGRENLCQVYEKQMGKRKGTGGSSNGAVDPMFQERMGKYYAG